MEIKNRQNQTIIRRKNGSLDISTVNTDETMTQQQFAKDCDVNNILKFHMQSGTPLPISDRMNNFMDVSNVTEYQKSLQTVYEAQKAFDQLPSDIRAKFENSPEQLISFMEDAKNIDEAEKLGLINKKQNQINEQTQTNEQIK